MEFNSLFFLFVFLPVFIGLILMTNLAFFNNEWIWYVSKVPEYRTWMLFLVSMADLLEPMTP